MAFTDITTVRCNNHTEHVNTPCGHNRVHRTLENVLHTSVDTLRCYVATELNTICQNVKLKSYGIVNHIRQRTTPVVDTSRQWERHLTGETPVAVFQRHHSVRSHVGDGELSWAQPQQVTAYDQRTVSDLC